MKTLPAAILLCLAASCSQQAPAPSSQPGDVVTREEYEAMRAERDALKEKLLIPGPRDARPYYVELPRWPALGGLYRPLGVDRYPTGDEVCFDAREASQWFAALNRALGGKR